MVKKAYHRDTRFMPGFGVVQDRIESDEYKEERAKQVADYTADYLLENEFKDHPRRKSQSTEDIQSEVTAIISRHAVLKDSIIDTFNKKSSAEKQIDYKRLSDHSRVLARSITSKNSNTTELLDHIEFLSKMKTIFSMNLFYSTTFDGKKFETTSELDVSMNPIGNNNDINIISLNLNNMTEAMNEKYFSTGVLLNCYMDSAVQQIFEINRVIGFTAIQKSNKEKQKNRSTGGRFYPAGLYLKKMRKGNRILSGLPLLEVRGGPRIAVINAVGGIGSGSSGNGVNGKSLGSDTLIAQVINFRELIPINRIIDVYSNYI